MARAIEAPSFKRGTFTMPIATNQEVLNFLGVSGSTKLTRIINGCNDFAETYCGRSFDLAIYEELIEFYPYQTEICLSQYPLVSMISLQDSSDADVTIAAQDDEAGILQISSSFWDAFPVIEDTSDFLTVHYQAGYSAANMPDDLKLAVFSMIGDRYYSGDSSIIQERLSDRSYRKSQNGLPLQTIEILDRYRKYG